MKYVMASDNSFGINKIAVIGAGEMGHGIAELAAISSLEVKLYDIEEEILENAMNKIEWSLQKLAEKDQISEDASEKYLENISTTTEISEAVNDVDVVIEAVPENIELKQNIFGDIDKHSPEGTVLATNTSGIPITKIAEGCNHPEKVVGMHFFNPPVLMNFIEIIRGEKTSDETVEVAEKLSEKLGKEYIVVRKDVQGFVTSRIIGPYMIEAAWQLHEGKGEMEEMDAACKYGVGFPMGPFELADQTGLDIPVEGAERGGLAAEMPPNLLEKVDAGDLGKKTGKGWHDWTEDGEGCIAKPEQSDAFDPLPIIAPTINEAARLVEWDVADPEEIDLAMRMATAYPKGPCRLGDELGLDNVLESIQGNERYEAADFLVEMVEEGKTGKDSGEGFYDYETEEREYFTIEFEREPEEKVATITLNRPDRMNALNMEVFEELEDVLNSLKKDKEIQCVVLRGAGDYFCAGADISMLNDITPATAPEMPDVFTQLEDLPKITIAAIDGYCLGGGLELASACDFRIAVEDSQLGQPEINLGLIPGGGGTQRLTRLVGIAKAKEIVILGNNVSGEEAEELNLVTKAVPEDEFEETLDGIIDKITSGPPIAQTMAKTAINRGTDAPLKSGLALEQTEFGVLLGTEDAKEGIDAFLKRRKPEFEGK